MPQLRASLIQQCHPKEVVGVEMFIKISFLRFQGWRVTYYGAGIIALIVGILTWFSLKEPERKSIGEEETKDSTDAKKITIWTVISDPRVIMLVLAASIRHCGNNNNNNNNF